MVDLTRPQTPDPYPLLPATASFQGLSDAIVMLPVELPTGTSS